ncbi:gliding motility-associated C-terminal domain-containing protein [Tenacibaculum ascidiaceicola]|uniref:T9SS type B sorting domain-containing protein n=1 Tax=Tenacibaculum ascidiaceicola TaxID=1699411 RepID=UPI0039EC9926
MKRSSKSILLLLATFLLCINSSAQVLESIVINDLVGVSNRALCDQIGGTDYSLDITFSGAAFEDDNTFTIELSDENGSFSDPSKVKTLRTLISTAADNYNEQFNIENISFQLPEGTYGKNYVIRVTTSNPVQTVQTDSFEAYYNMFAEGELSINNGNSFTLCNGETREVALDTDVIGEYLWYRVQSSGTDELVATTQEPKYIIAETGQYYVVIDYGLCGGPKSRFLTVDGLSGADTQIKGTSTIEICGDQSHTFEANVTNTSYTYNWYLDGELKQSSNNPTYTTPTVGQFGTYRLEIEAGTCTTVSNDVVLQQQTDAGYTVTNEGALKRIILFGETKQLCISHDATPVEDVTVDWFRNGGTMGTAVRNQLCISATTAGTYFARVTKSTGSACDAVVDSEEFVLLAVDSFNVVIRTATDYEECNSATTKLSMVGVKAIAEDGNEYDLTSDQIAMLNFDWKKDGVSIGATSEEYTVNSYADNGSYTLTVSTNTGKTGDSNAIDVKLVEVPQVSSTSTSNSLCAGSSIIYTIDNFNTSYNYQWIKDGDEDVTPTDPQTLVVTEVGEYVLKYSDSSCNNELAPINVIPFDDSAVTVIPSEIVVMEEGGSAIVVAAGGENYEWYQGEGTSGTLLSTTEQLEVTELGFYTVQVKVGNCTLYKTIEVVEPDGQIIVPNIVSPNQDGINDTWKLSNSYAYQPSVEIILYNSGGKEILKTTDYKNDWPLESLGNQKIFYYKIIREGKLIKAGTISVID